MTVVNKTSLKAPTGSTVVAEMPVFNPESASAGDHGTDAKAFLTGEFFEWTVD